MTTVPKSLLPLLACAFVFVVGCQSSTTESVTAISNERLLELRNQLVTAEEPPGAAEVSRVRKKLTPKKAIEGEPEPDAVPDSLDVVVAGRICAKKPTAENPDFPWQRGKAAFIMIDLGFEPSEHDHGDGKECHFCQEKEQDAQALVQILTENGEILSVDARDLLQVSEGQEIVVSGTASIVAGMLIINAGSVYAVNPSKSP